MKRAISVTLLSLCTMFLSCCECPPCQEITYEVTGMPWDNVVVEFLNELGTIDSYPVELPWTLTFTVQHRGDEYQDGHHPNGKFNAYISAVSPSPLTNLTASIYVGGKLMRSGKSTEARKPALVHYQVDL